MEKKNDSGIGIIDVPEAKTLSRKIMDYSFTAIMWVIWLYLLLPLISLVLWALGIHYFYNQIIATTNAPDVMAMMSMAGWSVLCVFVVLRLWGLYNYWAFGKHNRRKTKEMSSIYGLARFHNIPPSRILAMQERKELIWPMHRTLHPDRDIDDWLERKHATSVASQAASDSHDGTELTLPLRRGENLQKK
ncbi:MAG: poly-beta-1,6-N-acetyl-D-glucosamine biosynthesis protein PgaD [Mariprofundaceae bacterium]